MNEPTPKPMTGSNGQPLPPFTCGVCGYTMGAATCPADSAARPKRGDMSCCMKCGEVYVFNEKLECVVPTLAELNLLDAEAMAQLTRIQRVIRRERVLG